MTDFCSLAPVGDRRGDRHGFLRDQVSRAEAQAHLLMRDLKCRIKNIFIVRRLRTRGELAPQELRRSPLPFIGDVELLPALWISRNHGCQVADTGS
jgi:hypothetical protein